MANATYFVEVDWDNNGNFTGTYDDISADVKSIHYSRGKSDELGKAEVGQCSITVNNSTGKYTPGAGGVISALLLPKRPIRVRTTVPGSYNLFYGFIEEIIPHPHLTEQDCVITAVDGLDFLARHDMSTILYKNTLTGTIHDYILDDAGWSGTMRTLDTGQDTIPYWYGADVKARFAQEEIDKTEQGFSYVDGAGYFRFEDRYHRSTATHQTSQGTFTNTMSNISYSLNPKNVYNIIKVTVTPWELQPEAELWRLHEIPLIPPGETMTWWGESLYFVDNWVSPGNTTVILRPSGVGDETAVPSQSPSSTAHWDKVDEVTQDEDTTKVFAGGTGATAWYRDLYALEDSGLSGVINSVTIYIVCKKGNVWAAEAKASIKTEGTVYDGDEKALTTSYYTYSQTWLTNPSTLVAWTWAEINDLQAGVSLQHHSYGDFWGNPSCTQVYAVVDYVSNLDYTANSQTDGLGTDMTEDIGFTSTKFAKSIKLELKNNGIVPAYITLLKARGTWYDDQTKVTRKAEDTTSQTAYQKRTFILDGKYITDADKAQDFTNYAIGKYKDPRAELSMDLINQDAATLTQILSREVSDRVTVVNTKLGVSADYFIDYMEHDISMSGLSHKVTYRLADCINEDFWCLNYSALNVNTKLAY